MVVVNKPSDGSRCAFEDFVVAGWPGSLIILECRECIGLVGQGKNEGARSKNCIESRAEVNTSFAVVAQRLFASPDCCEKRPTD
jgi:hypothetical protein